MQFGTRLVKGLLVLLGMLTASAGSASETVTHQYDALGRLKQSASTGGPAAGTQTTLAYDPAGNRANVTVTGSANTPPSFAVGNAAGVTGGSPLVFTVTRSGTATTTLTVNYATSNGTASAGTDYTATSGTLTFLASETSKTVSVATLTAPTAGTRTVLMNLSGASGGATIATAQASGSVTFAGAPPTVAVAAAATVTGGSPLVFPVTLSAPATATVTVNYATANGTAAAGTDYTATSGTLTFLSGEASKAVSVTTLNPATAGTRTVLMNLSGATGGATIAAAQASGSVNYAGSSAPIVLTDSTLAVLPAHSSLYYCYNGGGAQGCILATTNVAVITLYQGNITSIKTGYGINWLGELEVEAAYYGTSN